MHPRVGLAQFQDRRLALLLVRVEPPVARPPARAVPLPALSPEPPIRPVWEEPAALAKRPRFALSLPPIVPPPGPLPGALPEPTAEPPIRKATASPGLPVPTISVPTLALPGGK